MKTLPIFLSTIEQVKSFTNDIMAFDWEMDVSSDRYIINAKSIMGLFSLDFSKPLQLSIHAGDNEDLTELFEVLKPYMADSTENT